MDHESATVHQHTPYEKRGNIMGLGQGREGTKHGWPAIVLVRWLPIVTLSPHFLHVPQFLGVQQDD
jgi:hypothetical protein